MWTQGISTEPRLIPVDLFACAIRLVLTIKRVIIYSTRLYNVLFCVSGNCKLIWIRSQGFKTRWWVKGYTFGICGYKTHRESESCGPARPRSFLHSIVLHFDDCNHNRWATRGAGKSERVPLTDTINKHTQAHTHGVCFSLNWNPLMSLATFSLS